MWRSSLFAILVVSSASFAADVGSSGWSCATSAPASATIDSGSNRKLVYIMTEERNTTPNVTLTSIGGQPPTETLQYSELSATQDNWHTYYIFDESTIGAMSGSTIVTSGTSSVTDECYATITDTDQAALSSLTGTGYAASAASVDCTTTSSSGDYVVVTGITQTIKDFTSWDTLTEFNDTDTASQTHGGAAGNGGDSTTTVTPSSSGEVTCASLVFPNSSAALLLRRRR